MPKETKEERVAQIQTRGYIIAALISASVTLVIGLITAFFAFEPFQEWVRGSGGKSLSIEKIPQRVFSYYGNAENLGGFSKLDILFSGDEIIPYYSLKYTIPSDRDGYAGMVFQFDKGQNVSGYSAIVLNIQFSKGSIPIDLFVKDIGGNGDHVRITSKGTGKTTFQYELSVFENVDFNALKEVGFNSDQSMVRGEYTMIISEILFTR